MDLSGQKFGKLLVLYRANDWIQPSGQHKKMWHCKCDCGNECDVRATDLKSGNTKSCGCYQNYSRGKSTFVDLKGQRFGKLVVLDRLPDHITPSGQKQRRWICKCDCGNTIEVYGTQLKNGRISCGCILKEDKERRLIEKKILRAEMQKNRIEQKRQEKIIKEKIKLEEKNKKKQDYLKQNSLASRFPGLIKEWNYEKNDIAPNEITFNSTQTVWWNCPSGHPYEMKVFLKTGKQKCSCPYCSSPAKKVLKGFNDLKTKYPLLVEEWHPTKNGDLKPDEVLCGTAKKVWWLGKCGHEYEQKIVSRVRGANCPYCSHQKLLVGFNDFATTNPELLSEWDYEKNEVLPSEIGVGVHKKIWWKCPFGHSYQSYPSNRCGSTHSGCPICDKENHTSFPEQALFYYIKKYFDDAINSDKKTIGMELDIYIPSLKIAVEYDGKNWHGNNKTEILKNTLCKEHNITLIRIREKGLLMYDDCICLLRDNLKSNDSLTSIIVELLKKISKNNKYDINVDRDSTNIYNLYISNRKSRSLKNTYPLIAAEWHPTKNGNLTPDMIAPVSNKNVWWLGKCGHEWQMRVGHRTNSNCGCPICSGKRIVSGINDLKTLYPSVVEEWNYELNDSLNIFPDKVAAHSDKKVWWICKKCNNVWQTKIDHRTRLNTGCPICGRKRKKDGD